MDRRINNRRITIERREDGKPVIVGYGSVFYREGDPGTEYELWRGFIERIGRNAFDARLTDDVRALFNHDTNEILGRSTAGTLKLSVDDVGLRYEIEPPDTQSGRDIITSIERGDVSGSSFSFTLEGGEQRMADLPDGTTIRTIERVGQLYDVGPVTFPAYEATTTGIRSAEDADEAKRALEAHRKEKEAVAVKLRMLDLDLELYP